jgi:hypothetical protein
VAALIVALGARTNRRWTVPIGAAIAMPVPYQTLFALLAVGVVGILEREPGGIRLPAAVAGRWRLRSSGEA